MIRFKFEINEKTQNYIVKSRKFHARLLTIIMMLIYTIPAFIIWFLFPNNIVVSIIVIGVFIFAIILSPIVAGYKGPLHAFKESEPQDIIINKETIESMGINKYCYKQYMVDDIKNVIDYGDFYAIVFYFPNLDKRFICLKDLIVEGTLEEFEQLFEDKIVRKTK
ncbi:MAG: hypothetical protein IKA85_08490 [Clostridia bacterium]|nr:hypothetical protein [Clostridia bacterium]